MSVWNWKKEIGEESCLLGPTSNHEGATKSNAAGVGMSCRSETLASYVAMWKFGARFIVTVTMVHLMGGGALDPLFAIV
jgi:hypothetical protein